MEFVPKQVDTQAPSISHNRKLWLDYPSMQFILEKIESMKKHAQDLEVGSGLFVQEILGCYVSRTWSRRQGLGSE